MRREIWGFFVAGLISALVGGCSCGNSPSNTNGGADSGSDSGTPTDGGHDGGAPSDGGHDGGNLLSDGGVCPLHQTACLDRCVNARVDPSNCGACGNVCSGSEACSAGVCASSCQAPLVICSNSCVDKSTDNLNCGACGSPCPDGMGCVNGSCHAEVPLGPPPLQCANGGPAISFGDGGTADCAGNLAQRTFRWALCSCDSMTLSATFVTDGFDSTQGPFADGGIGAGVGTNGSLKTTGPNFHIGGALWVTDGGITQSSTLTVEQDIYVGGDWTTGVSNVSGNGFVTGDISASNTSTLAGTLHIPSTSTISPKFTAGVVSRENVSVSPACDCSPSQQPAVTAIALAHASNNDNALIGLDPGVFAGPTTTTRLDLPCGNYYLDAITTGGPVAIVAHGNVALYVGGDITTNTLAFALDPSAEFDVFVGGSLCNTGGLKMGSPNYPAQMRMYVGGTGACGQAADSIHFTGPNNSFAGNVFSAAGYFSSSASVNYGSLITGSYSNSAASTIHYDRAVLGLGTRVCGGDLDAGTPPACTSCRDCNNQACVGNQCGACTSDSQCCAPLVCNTASGTCEPATCVSPGATCTESSSCCTGLQCLTPTGNVCPGSGAGCVCRNFLN
jgi:hypothetical protein